MSDTATQSSQFLSLSGSTRTTPWRGSAGTSDCPAGTSDCLAGTSDGPGRGPRLNRLSRRVPLLPDLRRRLLVLVQFLGAGSRIARDKIHPVDVYLLEEDAILPVLQVFAKANDVRGVGLLEELMIMFGSWPEPRSPQHPTVGV